MKDILLISPINEDPGGAIWKQIRRSFPSLGILSLAAFVRDRGFTVDVMDGNLENLDTPMILQRIQMQTMGEEGYRFIGISVTTASIYEGERIAGGCRKFFPGAYIVVGGPHAGALPEETLNCPHFDLCVRGEGEYPLLALLEGTPFEEIPGVFYRKGDAIIGNPSPPRIKDLDALPLPAYDLVPMTRSRPFIGQFVGLRKMVPATLILASRGCIGHCTFCSKGFAPGVAYKSPKRLWEEILLLKEEYGFQHFVFYDDTFTSNKKLVEEFCDLLSSSKVQITWTCSSRADCVDLELLKRMRNAGCTQVLYGTESFSDEVLASIRKRTTVQKNIDAIRWTREAGMLVRVAIMIGNPADTIHTLKHNIRMLKRLMPDMIQVTITTPLPGSQMFQQGKEEGALLTTDWTKYNGDHTVMKHPVLSEKELRKYYYKTYAAFYFGPRFVLKRLFSRSTYKQIRIYWNGFVCLLPVFFIRTKKEASREN